MTGKQLAYEMLPEGRRFNMKRAIMLLMAFGLGAGLLFSQSINLKMGVFLPSLQSDLWEENIRNLAFNKSDLINIYEGVEFEYFPNRYTSLSLEIGTYHKTVYSEYTDYTYEDGSPIRQNISLRIMPIEANIKLYPLGRRNTISPYVGAGAGLYVWRYQQWGDFVIFPEAYIREEEFAETKTFSFGFNGRAGLLIRFHPRVALSLEGKYQYLRGQLSGYFEGFEKLDLGGITTTVGINFFL
jgi:hypothetical protein